jgi:hypothetical protein
MAVFCSFLTLWFPGMLLTYFLNDFEMVPVAPVITGIIFVFTFYMRCISIVRSLLLLWGTKMVTIQKVPRRSPLVLLAKMGRIHDEAWGSEEGSMLGSGLLEVWSRGMKVGVWTKF